MKTKLLLMFLSVAVLLSSFAYAVSYSFDTGKITTLFASQSGSIAITLDGGFPNATAASQCPTSSNGWAGNAQPSNTLKAALMMAKATNATVTITTQGCEGNGGWLKIIDMYIK